MATTALAQTSGGLGPVLRADAGQPGETLPDALAVGLARAKVPGRGSF